MVLPFWIIALKGVKGSPPLLPDVVLWLLETEKRSARRKVSNLLMKEQQASDLCSGGGQLYPSRPQGTDFSVHLEPDISFQMKSHVKQGMGYWHRLEEWG